MEDKNCKYLLGSLSDYVDGEAQESICREIERHLSDCDNCRVVVDTLRKTVSLYHATSEIELPTEVRSRLFVRLNLKDFINSD